MAGTDPGTIGAVLHRWAAVAPERPFVLSPDTGRGLSFGQIQSFAAALDRFLSERDVGPGERVAIYLGNGLAMSALFVGTMALGRTVTPINLLSQGAQLAYVIEHCDAKLLFTSAEHLPKIDQCLAGASNRPRIEVIDPDSVDWAGQAASAAGDVLNASGFGTAQQVALLMYTSGTTGKPKGAMLTHANLLHAAGQVARWHGLGTEDRALSALPLYHINGQVIGTLAPLVAGGSTVAPHRFSASAWWAIVQRFGCTWLNMVPTIIAYLLNAPEADDPPAESLSRVRFGRSASAPLPPEHHRAFEQRFRMPLIEAMGMTESASVVFCNPMPPGPRKIGSPGVPVGIDARVVDPQGQDCPDHRQGEIWLRGANVMAGYFKSPDQTAEALTQDGWLRSGDLGHRDADGYYFITGRLKELIIKGGENIAPREIDEVLLRHPSVLEAAAVGIPHPAYGQEILACVVLRESEAASEDALIAFCRQEIGPYKAPSVIRFVRTLPTGPSGKVQRLRLIDWQG
jgi:long-chain acyl-CoA synthetase